MKEEFNVEELKAEDFPCFGEFIKANEFSKDE